MQKVAVELSEKQAEQLLEQLSPTVKLQLVRRWEHQTWPTRFQQLLARLDQRLRQAPRLAQEARKTIGPSRRAFHARRHRY